MTLPVEIYTYTKKPLQPKIYALFTLLFLLILVLMVTMNLHSAPRGRKTSRCPAAGYKGEFVHEKRDFRYSCRLACRDAALTGLSGCGSS